MGANDSLRAAVDLPSGSLQRLGKALPSLGLAADELSQVLTNPGWLLNSVGARVPIHHAFTLPALSSTLTLTISFLCSFLQSWGRVHPHDYLLARGGLS